MSAHAAEVSMSGSASIGIYQESEADKSKFYNNDSITFTVTGETDGGLTITNTVELDASSAHTGGTDNAITTIAMDGVGTLTYGRHGASSVVGGWDSIAPTAYEEVWDAVETSASVANNVIGGKAGNGLFRFDTETMSGVTVSASYARVGLGTDNSIVLIANDLVDNMSMGIGTGTNTVSATTEDDMTTAWATYTTGPITMGAQLSEIDKTAANSDVDRQHVAVSFAVNENLSISYV